MSEGQPLYQFDGDEERQTIIQWYELHQDQGLIAAHLANLNLNHRLKNTFYPRFLLIKIQKLRERYPGTDIEGLAPLGRALLQLASEGQVELPSSYYEETRTT